MTQPPEVLYASQQYQEWLAALKDAAMLATHNQSHAMMRAVLHELRRYLTTEQVLTFADALPPLPRGIFIEGWRPGTPVPPPASAADFDAAMTKALSPHHVPPASIVANVFAVLAAHVGPRDAATMRSTLPEVLKPLWPAATDGDR